MIAVLLAAVLSTSLFIFVHAEKSCFEECYHCQMTGEYRCAECGNTGEVVCDGCHGEGGSVCQGAAVAVVTVTVKKKKS